MIRADPQNERGQNCSDHLVSKLFIKKCLSSVLSLLKLGKCDHSLWQRLSFSLLELTDIRLLGSEKSESREQNLHLPPIYSHCSPSRMIEILKKSLQEIRVCPFVRKRCLACDYVQLNAIRDASRCFWSDRTVSRRDSFKFPHGLRSKLGSASIEPHSDLHQSERLALSRMESYGRREIDMRESVTLCVSIALFVFVLFLCISFRSLTRCDETGQVWYPRGPKKLRQRSLMGEVSVIHSLWILIKFSLSVSAVFLFPAEMASTHQGPVHYIYRLVSIRGTYCRNEVCLHA